MDAELNQQSVSQVDHVDPAMIAAVVQRVGEVLNITSQTVSVAFVDPQTIQALNRDMRGKDKPTDVLAFPLDPDEDVYVGEVLICAEVAKKQATQHERTYTDEVADLLIHGVLHVLGYDHETEQDAAVMLPLQEKIYTSLQL